MNDDDKTMAAHWRKHALENEETIQDHETGRTVFLGSAGTEFIERLKRNTKELWKIVAAYGKRDA